MLSSLLWLVACGADPEPGPGAEDPCPSDIQVSPHPLLPLRGEDASFAVSVEDPDGVERVEVTLSSWPVEAPLDALAPSGLPARRAALACRPRATGGAAAGGAGAPVTAALDCEAPLSRLLDGPSLLQIEVRVRDGCGVHRPTVRRWELAAGLSADGRRGVGWGVPGLEGVPVPVLRRSGDPARHIDLGFVDTSEHFPGERVAATRALLGEALEEQLFGAEAIAQGRELWSFYLEPAAPESCSPGAAPSPVGPVDAGVDIHLALCPALDGSASHLPPAADTEQALRAIYVQGAGASVQAAPGAVRHELGHAAFYLSDEYGRVNGGAVLDAAGPSGERCDQPTWFNNLLPLASCRWYWRCFQGGEGSCQPPEWEGADAPRVVESGEGCVMSQTHGRGGTADFGHSCGRRVWRTYEAVSGSAPLSLICRYGGRASGCQPIDACARRARLGAALAAAAPAPGTLERLHIQFRGGRALSARREVVRGYPRTPALTGRAAVLVALRGGREIASAPLGDFWLARHEPAAPGAAPRERLDFELVISVPLADPRRPPDGYVLAPLSPAGERGQPLVQLSVGPAGALSVAASGPLPGLEQAAPRAAGLPRGMGGEPVCSWLSQVN